MAYTFLELAVCKTGAFPVIHPVSLNALIRIMAGVVEAFIDLVHYVHAKYMTCVRHVHDMCMTCVGRV